MIFGKTKGKRNEVVTSKIYLLPGHPEWIRVTIGIKIDWPAVV
jgi:hypothetical protein